MDGLDPEVEGVIHARVGWEPISIYDLPVAHKGRPYIDRPILFYMHG